MLLLDRLTVPRNLRDAQKQYEDSHRLEQAHAPLQLVTSAPELEYQLDCVPVIIVEPVLVLLAATYGCIVGIDGRSAVMLTTSNAHEKLVADAESAVND